MITLPEGVVFSLRFQDKSISKGTFFLELLSAVEPRLVNWSIVTRGETGKACFL